MSVRVEFINWYNERFRDTTLYTSMAETVEDSPWHRERNVAVHTDMVVGQYLSRASATWSNHTLAGALACAFHDVGKPPAKVEKFREDRGHYVAFTGHEIVSARMWEEFAVQNWTELSTLFGLIPWDIYAVAWMIEHHLPYGVKKADKIERIMRTALAVGGITYDEGPVFGNVLIADGFGRMSDDADTKRANVMEYVRTMTEQVRESACSWHLDMVNAESATKVLYMPIGASGSGKSTWKAELPNTGAVSSYSWDDLRLEWYDPDDYTNAFRLQCEDKTWKQRADHRFREVLNSGADKVVVDNTNLSVKGRRQFVDQARRAGYTTVAVLFPVDQATLTVRQAARTDKFVPLDAVLRHWNSLQMPFYGEFDKVVVHDGNL